MPNFVVDNHILWLELPKVGSPPAWQPHYNYKLGDVVVPTNPQPGQEELMFQCVGFIGKSSSTTPTFPQVEGQILKDNEVIWETKLLTSEPRKLSNDEYYILEPTYQIL